MTDETSGGGGRASGLLAAHAALAVAVAAPLSALVWVWGHVRWLAAGSPDTVRYAAWAVFALLSLLAWYGLSFEPSRALGGLALLLAVGLPTCGGCLSAFSEYNPGGGSSFMFAPNLPRGYGHGAGAVLLGGFVLGLGSCWLLRRAALRRDPQPAAPFVLAGRWLAGASACIAGSCRGAPLLVDRWLVPLVALGGLLSLLGLGLSRPRSSWLWAGLAVAIILGSAGLEVVWSRSPVARCEQAFPSLVVAWRTDAVTEYRASGVELERLVCQMSFQYADQEARVVYGKLADGRTLSSAQSFARVGGPALERSRAACELLFSADCDRLAPVDSSLGVAAPREHDGKLVFYGLHDDYAYGPSTRVGMVTEPTRYEVDLRTLATSFTR